MVKANKIKLGIQAMMATLLLGSMTVVQADYLWLEPAQDGMHAYLGMHETSTKADLSSLNAPRAFLTDGKELALKAGKEYLQVAAVPADMRVTAQVVEQDNVLHFYQARFGRHETKAVNDLELVPTEPGGKTFRLIWKDSPVAASQVNVSTSDGWIRTLKPAEDGSVTLDTPFPGLYILEVTARVNGSMTYQGRKFEDVRHTATLSFEVQP
ncbi:hypothetical protein SAMN05192560_1155 [Methylobacillus rhizosphaerae]|uniref:DUF4198 domain-containing protein n=1 Tax=Methylobacillus rhizosphaerae TaxID=551994 RepID=A0A238Z9T7_9PROT|nr:hypothetical protein [Methylobacillus rhizosphaerae]SNR80087.1 hypothetical protein SAMN05192560_1155 [Methylobacillus rhizosphaerae]